MVRWGLLVGAVLGLGLTGFTVTGCEQTDGSTFVPGSYTVREAGVNFRAGGQACANHPGPASCPAVLAGLRPGQRLYPICQQHGQLVGRNDYWVHAWGPRGRVGWVSSWYLSYPANRLPELPDCTADMIRYA